MTRSVMTLGAALLWLVVAPMTVGALGHDQNDLLTEEERLWLKNRNSSIVVYPERNSPPFVYLTDPSAPPTGLSIEYLELVAEKVGARLVYLPARSRAQIHAEFAQGKGDVIARIDQTNGSELATLRYTEPYLSTPAVIAVRKDAPKGELNLGLLAGKRVAATDASAAAQFVRKNYPRVVLHMVSDDEIGLQQLVLGEVDALIIDVASLAYFLDRQVTAAVRVAGHTGFSYQLAFAVPGDRAILQSILDKGLSQISTAERTLLNDKWIQVGSSDTPAGVDRWFGGRETLVIALAIVGGALIVALAIFLARRHPETLAAISGRVRLKRQAKAKLDELAETEAILKEKLEKVHALEEEVLEVVGEGSRTHS